MFALIRYLVACVLIASQFAFGLPTIEIKGAKFFTSDGDQFFIKGVNYQPGGVSNNNFNGLTDSEQCKIDAQLIGELGANVIRVYSVDPTLNHDDCMKAFADKGIYVIVDMSTPTYSINRAKPEWTKELRDAFAQVIDGFQGYDNLLAFFAGNEIINDESTSECAPYAKAVVADMKAYRDLMQYRKIPIGYSAADLDGLRTLQQDYFDCGGDKVASDFYAFNNYAWCDPSSMEESGYDRLYDEADGYDIPIFLSETGCNLNADPDSSGNRTWESQIAMLGREMNDRYSGNIVYEWSMEDNGYGLVSYSNDAATGTPTLLEDYDNLKTQWATLSPTGVKASAYNPSLTKRDCPASTSSKWLVQKGASLPTIGTSGFTAPTGPRSTSGATETGTAGGAAPETTQSTGPSQINGSNGFKEEKSKTPVGAIAGGVLGGLVVLALILGAILFCLKRKRKQKAVEVSGDAVGPNAGSDKMVVANEQEKIRQNGFYGPNYHELNGNGTTQELDPARGHVAPMPANEMSSARGPMEMGEHGEPYSPPSPPVNAQSAPTQQEPSPYVQQQRRMEMDWLESEEARLRQRREVLRQQDGGGS